MRKPLAKNKGAILILTFIIMVTLAAITIAFLYMTSMQTRSSGRSVADAKAFWVAEAGRAKARWALTTGGKTVGWGETANPFGSGKGTYVATTAYSDPPTNQHVTITSSGYIPNNADYVARRQVVESDIPFGGDTNLSLGAGASASSQSGSHSAEDANDGNSSSKWMAHDKDDAWLKLNFGSPTTFDQVVINGQNNINSVTIGYSNNDIAYSSVTSLTESPAWMFTFDLITAQYLRLNMGVDSNKKAEVNELETYNTAQEGLGQGEFSTSW